MNVFGLLEETGEPGQNPHRHEENVSGVFRIHLRVLERGSECVSPPEIETMRRERS